MKRFNLCLSTDQFTAFARRAKLQNTSRSAVMRAALDSYFEQRPSLDRKTELEGLFGAWRDMPSTCDIRTLRAEERSLS